MNDITDIQRDLLYVIAGFDHLSSQSVKDELQEYYETEINHGRFFPNLDTVVTNDLVDHLHESDAVRGFELGAANYDTKPLSLSEVSAEPGG